jgi:hypothetical protein
MYYKLHSKPLECWFIGGDGYDILRHFQQYFSYIVAVSFIGGENHRPVASH